MAQEVVVGGYFRFPLDSVDESYAIFNGREDSGILNSFFDEASTKIGIEAQSTLFDLIEGRHAPIYLSTL